MNKVSRQHPAFCFAYSQMFGVEVTGDISSRAISLGKCWGKSDVSYLITGICWSTSCSTSLPHLQRLTSGCSPEHGSAPQVPTKTSEFPGHVQSSGQSQSLPGSVISWITLRYRYGLWPVQCPDLIIVQSVAVHQQGLWMPQQLMCRAAQIWEDLLVRKRAVELHHIIVFL